jgi:calcium-dependent protein kinase
MGICNIKPKEKHVVDSIKVTPRSNSVNPEPKSTPESTKAREIS